MTKTKSSWIGLRLTITLLLTGLIILSVALVTLITYTQSKELARHEIGRRLETAAAAAAHAINADDHAKIFGLANSLSPEFLTLQSKLRELQSAIPDARFVYTFRKRSDGKIVFIGDSDSSSERSSIGEVYPSPSPALEKAFSSRVAAIAEDQLSSDRWGTWLSGYAPLVKSDGSVNAVVGVDLAAHDVRDIEKRYLILGALSAAILLAFFVPFSLFMTNLLSAPLKYVSKELAQLARFQLNTHVPFQSAIHEFQDLADSLDRTRMGLRSFSKFVPREVKMSLAERLEEANRSASKREITILFTDFAGFTKFSNDASPAELSELLNSYFEAIGRVIMEHRGTIDKFIGDAVMAFWNAPFDVHHHAMQASRAAKAIAHRIAVINRERTEKGLVGLPVRIGLHTGEAMVGNFGSEAQMSYTAIGDAVNLASRLEQLNKELGTEILLSQQTAAQLSKKFNLKPLGEHSIEGFQNRISIFELISSDY